MAYVGALAVGVGEVPRIITYAHWSIKDFSGSAESRPRSRAPCEPG